MPITKRPTSNTPAPAAEPAKEEAIQEFIQGAPDAKPAIPLGISVITNKDGTYSNTYDKPGATEQITIRIPSTMLERATKMAERQGIPRASYIKRALALQLNQDEAE